MSGGYKREAGHTVGARPRHLGELTMGGSLSTKNSLSMGEKERGTWKRKSL